MSKYKKSGGKLIITHGWADTGITPENTVWYYEQVLNKMGKNQSDWMRLFMAPGMGHCAGGPGPNQFDAVTALEQWVEKGVAPDMLIATHSVAGKVDRARPLCPYPQVARYKGTGSIDEAASFSCAAPGPSNRGTPGANAKP
jgi:feruloyl esterase